MTPVEKAEGLIIFMRKALIWLAVIVFVLVCAYWALGILIGVAHAQMTGADFCQGRDPAKSSAVINCSGTGECLLVGAVTNQQVQVCSIVFDLSGTSPTAQVDYGTQTTNPCDTGTTHLTGAMTASKVVDGPLDFFTAPSGNQLCLKLGGASPTAVGVMTYVQK
jgi:hypothetical protein